jgi:hypothetical protein
MIPISFQYRFAPLSPRISIPEDCSKIMAKKLLQEMKKNQEEFIRNLWEELTEKQKIWWIENY